MPSLPLTERRRPMRRLRPLLAACGLVLLAACAGYSPSAIKPGQSADEVTQAMGKPTARYAQPDGGERIEYATGPVGKETFMIDMDPSGHVIGWNQVLTEPNFASLKIGTPRDDVLQKLGTPSARMHIGFQDRDIWNYRYESMGYCRWFQVSINGKGRVIETGYGPDPACDPGSKDPRQ